MKKSRMVSAVMALVFVVSGYGIAMGQSDSAQPAAPPAASADQAGHADHASHGAAAATSQPAEQATGEHAGHAGHDMSQMCCMGGKNQQEDALAAHMQAMQGLMEKIAATANPAERKSLMAEHVTMMASGMKMMREMDGAMMQGMMQSGKCPMMEKMASPQGHAAMQGKMDAMPMCHAMMQKKAERQYALLEQIIESQKQLLKLAP